MNKPKKYVQILSILGILGFTILSCEQNDEAVGYGFLNGEEANALKTYIDVIAYNLYNNDSIRSDESVLSAAVIGVYDEAIFGKVRASYVTQLRLPTLNQIFSDSIESGLPKATVDSVVLYFSPTYNTSEDEVTVDTLYTDELGNPYDQDNSDDVDTFRIVTKYPITNKYGNAANAMNLNIHTVGEFLYSIDSTYYSNKVISEDQLIGSGTVSNYVVGVKYTNTNRATVDSINGNDVNDITPSVRIPLDLSFFQNQIINQQGSINLSDQSRFIRYINGIKISTSDNNAFLMTIDPNALSLRMYYSYTKKKDDDGEIEEGNTSYLFSLNNPYNVRIGLYERDASLSPYLSPFVGNSNYTTGDDALYLDGMGGFKSIVTFDASQIDQLKYNFVNHHTAIVGAKLTFYKHPLSTDLENPTHIFAYKYNNLMEPISVSDLVRDDYSFIEDPSAFSSLIGYSFNPAYDSSNNYYEINVTEYVKNIVEKDSTNYPLIVEMGNFATDNNGLYSSVYRTNKPYNPFRMVFKGNLYSDNENLKLQVLYTEN